MPGGNVFWMEENIFDNFPKVVLRELFYRANIFWKTHEIFSKKSSPMNSTLPTH
eukprot:TRINITY_DN1544_c1_g1_i1.p4 TRINITY_DN1544_c1_g1~~TRINITY_DN1544_c1_g1_i1.p4  ORF type:complete len:54 (-),score=5.08 TRINITY_DN1544_c1_g1_i1:750-911(-)